MFILLHSENTLYKEIKKFIEFLTPYIVIHDIFNKNNNNYISLYFRHSNEFKDYTNMHIPRMDQELIQKLEKFCTDNQYRNIYKIIEVENDFKKYNKISSSMNSYIEMMNNPLKINCALQYPPEIISKKIVNITLEERDFDENLMVENIMGNVVTLHFPQKSIQIPKSLALRSQYMAGLIENFSDNNNYFLIEIIQNYSNEDIEKLVRNLIRKSKEDENLDIIKFFILD